MTRARERGKAERASPAWRTLIGQLTGKANESTVASQTVRLAGLDGQGKQDGLEFVSSSHLSCSIRIFIVSSSEACVSSALHLLEPLRSIFSPGRSSFRCFPNLATRATGADQRPSLAASLIANSDTEDEKNTQRPSRD